MCLTLTNRKNKYLMNPFDHLKAAATGDLEVQRALADLSVRLAAEEEDLDPYVVLSESLVFARLAAAHGDARDQARVIAMLQLAANLSSEDGASDLEGESLACIAAIVDGGDEAAALCLTSRAERATPRSMAMAQE